MKLTRKKSPKKSNFTLERKITTFFLMCLQLGLNKDNEKLIHVLSLDIDSQILRENMLSINIRTRNIFYDNYNTSESIYSFLLNPQDETKQVIHPTLTYKDSFSNYLKYFVDEVDNETVKNLTFLHTEVLNIYLINLTTIYFFAS